MISENMLNLIKKWEGLALTAYTCPAGLKTIGYGHVISNQEKFNNITEQDAEELLLHDLHKIYLKLYHLINFGLLNQNQIDAIISFTFNVGINAFIRSSLRQKIKQEQHELAAQEFLKWVWCKGKKLKGLIIRREIESHIYASSVVVSNDF